MLDLKAKGGRLIKTSLGVIPVSPEQNGLFPTNSNYRLWVYAVIVFFKSMTVVKFGDHRCRTRKEAHRYATTDGNTIGKFQGLVGQQDIKVLLVEDVTDIAKTIDLMYDPTLDDVNIRKGFDNVMRSSMPGKRKKYTNPDNGSSLELHIVDNDKSLEEHQAEWHKAIDTYKNNGLEVTPTKIYYARPFTNDFDNKIDKSNKCLLAGCPGSGKEAACLCLAVRISDKKQYTNNLINVFTATIPDTLCEPLNEIAVLKGMIVNGNFVDFSRIKLYIVQSWFSSNKKDLLGTTQAYLRSKATFIESADDIPAIHSKLEVPILIAGYNDIAYDGNSDKIRTKYASLEGRIGTLLVGEGHKFLKPGNKMWKVFTKLGWKFLMPVTGTPYDLIFGCDDVLYFPPEQRSIMTRQEMILDKINNPNSDFKDMPIINYYGITEIYTEVIEKMKQDPRWKDDAEGMTMQKLHTTYNEDTKTFKYFEFLHRMYSRLLASDGFGDYDGLAIKNAPNLCEAGKNNLLCILPIGMLGVGVKTYIPELVRQLKDAGALGVYEPYVSYDEDMLDVKQAVEDPNKKTITFTAIKNTTGTNIKGWGSTILMRPVGDSLTFLEQGPEGRIGRASEGKINSGLFLMEPYNAINLKVMVEEKLSIERGENKSHNQIINDTLACHFFYDGKAGKFTQLNKPDFQSKLEEMSARGNYGISLCINHTEAPKDFDLVFKNRTAQESEEVEINNAGNKDAKNNRRKIIKQLQFEFDNDKNKNKSWNNMKKKHLARARKIAFIKDFGSLQEIVKWIDSDLEKDPEVRRTFGKGVELIPEYMLQPKEINVEFVNRWISKIDLFTDIKDFLILAADPALLDNEKQYIPESLDLIRQQIEILYEKHKKNITNKNSFIDISAGRGAYLIMLLEIGKKLNIDINPKKLYYNDIDKNWVDFFKKINNKFNLGIPEKNITCEDALEKKFDMEFDFSITNVAYNTREEEYTGDVSVAGGKMGTVGDKNYGKKLNAKAREILKQDTGVAIQMGLKQSMFDDVINDPEFNPELISLMVDKDWWRYNTFYVIGKKQKNKKQYKLYQGDINSSIVSKFFKKKDFKFIIQQNSYTQLKENGFITDKNNGNTLCIVRNNKKDDMKIIRAYPTEKGLNKVIHGPKFMHYMVESAVTWLATDEPVLCDCSVVFPTKTLDEAKKMKLFTEKSPLLRFAWKTMKIKGQDQFWQYCKSFDLNQISLGTEYPVEYNLTEEEKKYLNEKFKRN